jgi:hypothetical protein
MAGITFRLSPAAAAEINDLAERNGYTAADLFRWGAGLAKLLLEEQEQGHTLILIDEAGKPLSKIVLPQSQCGVIANAAREILSEPYSLSLERAIADLDPDPAR